MSIFKTKIKNSIVIFSEARGGSTWLMEMIKSLPNSVVNWEPLHVEKGVVPNDYKWGWRPYIKPQDKTAENLEIMENILKFNRVNEWTLKYTPLRQFNKPETIITKFVRANMLIPWISINFKFKYKPIVLIRHPIATCLSQIRSFHPKQEEITLQVPDCINNERFKIHADYVNSLESNIQKKVAIWCLNNCYIFENLKWVNKCVVVFYEDLVMNGEKEIRRIFNESGIKASYKDLDINISKPSDTAIKKNLVSNSEKQLSKYKDQLNNLEIETIQNIFNHFNFTLYKSENPYPLKNNLGL